VAEDQVVVAPSSPSQKPRLRFSLLSLCILLTLLSVWFALMVAWGEHGLILALDVLALGWGLARVTRIERLCGLSIPRLTLGDFLVLCAVCYVFHLTAMPAHSIVHRTILPLDVLAVSWGLASITGMQWLFGRKLTFGEFLVLCVICGVLHGIATPPVVMS
jgi:hypothetical protein